MNSKHITIVLALALATILTPGYGQHLGQNLPPQRCGPVLDQEVCTWVVIQGADVLEVGATIPLALIETVPLDAEMTWPPAQMAAIPLPDEARSSLGLDHLGINWEAHGHPPGPFLTPHFDFHFYSLTIDELRGVDCTDESKPLTLPDGYGLPDVDVPGLGMLLGLCVPHMGMHAMRDADMTAAGPFEATMVMGYYGGEAIFVEPMVSRDRLLERADFSLSVPAARDLPEGVRHPTAFRAEYDAASDQYRLILSGFRGR